MNPNLIAEILRAFNKLGPGSIISVDSIEKFLGKEMPGIKAITVSQDAFEQEFVQPLRDAFIIEELAQGDEGFKQDKIQFKFPQDVLTNASENNNGALRSGTVARAFEDAAKKMSEDNAKKSAFKEISEYILGRKPLPENKNEEKPSVSDFSAIKVKHPVAVDRKGIDNLNEIAVALGRESWESQEDYEERIRKLVTTYFDPNKGYRTDEDIKAQFKDGLPKTAVQGLLWGAGIAAVAAITSIGIPVTMALSLSIKMSWNILKDNKIEKKLDELRLQNGGRNKPLDSIKAFALTFWDEGTDMWDGIKGAYNTVRGSVKVSKDLKGVRDIQDSDLQNQVNQMIANMKIRGWTTATTVATGVVAAGVAGVGTTVGVDAAGLSGSMPYTTGWDALQEGGAQLQSGASEVSSAFTNWIGETIQGAPDEAFTLPDSGIPEQFPELGLDAPSEINTEMNVAVSDSPVTDTTYAELSKEFPDAEALDANSDIDTNTEEPTLTAEQHLQVRNISKIQMIADRLGLAEDFDLKWDDTWNAETVDFLESLRDGDVRGFEDLGYELRQLGDIDFSDPSNVNDILAALEQDGQIAHLTSTGEFLGGEYQGDIGIAQIDSSDISVSNTDVNDLGPLDGDGSLDSSTPTQETFTLAEQFDKAKDIVAQADAQGLEGIEHKAYVVNEVEAAIRQGMDLLVLRQSLPLDLGQYIDDVGVSMDNVMDGEFSAADNYDKGQDIVAKADAQGLEGAEYKAYVVKEFEAAIRDGMNILTLEQSMPLDIGQYIDDVGVNEALAENATKTSSDIPPQETIDDLYKKISPEEAREMMEKATPLSEIMDPNNIAQNVIDKTLDQYKDIGSMAMKYELEAAVDKLSEIEGVNRDELVQAFADKGYDNLFDGNDPSNEAEYEAMYGEKTPEGNSTTEDIKEKAESITGQSTDETIGGADDNHDVNAEPVEKVNLSEMNNAEQYDFAVASIQEAMEFAEGEDLSLSEKDTILNETIDVLKAEGLEQDVVDEVYNNLGVSQPEPAVGMDATQSNNTKIEPQRSPDGTIGGPDDNHDVYEGPEENAVDTKDLSTLSAQEQYEHTIKELNEAMEFAESKDNAGFTPLHKAQLFNGVMNDLQSQGISTDVINQVYENYGVSDEGVIAEETATVEAENNTTPETTVTTRDISSSDGAKIRTEFMSKNDGVGTIEEVGRIVAEGNVGGLNGMSTEEAVEYLKDNQDRFYDDPSTVENEAMIFQEILDRYNENIDDVTGKARMGDEMRARVAAKILKDKLGG